MSKMSDVRNADSNKSVTIRKVNNGYVVRNYNYKTNKEIEVVAKTSEEAMKITQRLFEGKPYKELKETLNKQSKEGK